MVLNLYLKEIIDFLTHRQVLGEIRLQFRVVVERDDGDQHVRQLVREVVPGLMHFFRTRKVFLENTMISFIIIKFGF